MAGWLDQLFAGQGGGILGGAPPWLQNTGGPQAGWQDNVGQPGSLDPKWQALLAGQTDPYSGGGAQLPTNAAPTAGVARNTLAQPAESGFGQQGEPGNPIAGLLGGLGNGISSLFSGMQANGQPGAPQQPGQAAPAPAAAGPGIMDRLTAGATNFTTGGNPIAGLLNSISGLATGQRTDRMGIAQANQRATMQALIPALMKQPGMDLPTAMGIAQSASVNPEVLKTIAPQLYTKPVYQKTGTDTLTGQDSGVWLDPGKQTATPAVVNGVPVGPGGAAAAGSSAVPPSMQQLMDQIEHGRSQGAAPQELLKLVPNSLRSGVDAMLNGKAVPANLSARGSARDLTLRLAHAVDPNFDEMLIPQRKAWATSFGSSAPSSNGGQIQSAGTIVKHLGDAYAALPAIDKGMWGPSDTLNALNPIKSGIRSQYGDKAFLDAKGQYDVAVKGIAGEMERLLTGGHGAESSKEYWLKRLNLDVAPAERQAALDEARSLMWGRLTQIAEQKDRAFGGHTDPYSFLGANEQKIAKEINAGRYHPVAPTAAPATLNPAVTQNRDALIAEAKRRGLIP